MLAFYPTFRLHNRDSTVARSLRATIAQRQQLGVGLPAPAITLLDNTDKKVSLSDLRGKVVYLDFWGTWCALCMHEMTEFAPALKKKFEGRDVVFLYIPVGDAEAKWRQTLAEKQFTGPNSVPVGDLPQLLLARPRRPLYRPLHRAPLGRRQNRGRH